MDVPTRLTAHNRPTFDFTPNGREVALVSLDHHVRRFDLATGRALEPPLLDLPALALQFHASGAVALLVAVDELQVWHPNTRKLIARCRLPGIMNDFCWHPNGDMLALATDRGIFLWRVGDPDVTAFYGTGYFTRVFFNPEGDLLLCGGWGGLGIVNTVSGALLLSQSGRHALQLSRDGRQLATANGRGGVGVCPLLRPKGWRELPLPRLANTYTDAVDIHPGGRWLLSGHVTGWVLWDYPTGQIVRHQREAKVSSVQFESSEAAFVTSSAEGVHRWPFNPDDGRHVVDLPSGHGYGFFQTRGDLLFGKSSTDYGIWRLGTWELVRRVSLGAAGAGSSLIGNSPDDHFIVLSDATPQLRFRDSRNDRDFAIFPNPGTAAWTGRFDRAGSRLVCNSSRRCIGVLDLAELRQELSALGLDWQDESPGEGFAPRR